MRFSSLGKVENVYWEGNLRNPVKSGSVEDIANMGIVEELSFRKISKFSQGRNRKIVVDLIE